MRAIARKIVLLLEMIRFSHTVFALPFAVLAAVLAAEGVPDARTCLWILAAMVGARSAAMTFNRIVDRKIDAGNPRTQNRHLVTGSVSVAQAWMFLAGMAGLFFCASWQLNPLALQLSPVALLVIFSYSYAKRVSALCHFLLGASLALAPVGAWVAVRGEIGEPALYFAAVVMLWTAGFDIIYACQDHESDVKAGLKSIPVRFGIKASLRIAAVMHLAMLGVLVAMAFVFGGTYFIACVVLIAALLAYEHSLVRADDLARVNHAFFTCNAVVSLLLMTAVLLDVFLR